MSAMVITLVITLVITMVIIKMVIASVFHASNGLISQMNKYKDQVIKIR